jgi:hypothetical protein
MINQHVLYLYAGDILAAAETKKRRGRRTKKKKKCTRLVKPHVNQSLPPTHSIIIRYVAAVFCSQQAD